MDQAGASRGLKEMSSLFSQLKPKLSPYAVEKWNNVFFSFVIELGTQKVATVGHFIISEEAKTISTRQEHSISKSDCSQTISFCLNYYAFQCSNASLFSKHSLFQYHSRHNYFPLFQRRFPLDFGCILECYLLVCFGFEVDCREDSKKSVYIDSIQNSILLLREITGSVLLRNVTNSIVSVCCEQLRVHCSTDVLFCLEIPNHPVIEDSHHVFFTEKGITWSQPRSTTVEKVHVFSSFNIESLQ